MSDENAVRLEPSQTVRRVAFLALTYAWLVPRSAQAQEPSQAERAQALFSEGRALMQARQFPEACAKFAESEALEPGGGTILNLGICRRREGRSATAFKLLSEALTRARADGRADRVATAERHLAELGPRLSRLTVRLTLPVAPQGMALRLDGEPFALSLLGEAVALDPGVHQLQATQPGCQPWNSTVALEPVADLKTIEVPSLPPSEAGQPPTVVPVEPAARSPFSLPSRPASARSEARPNWLGVGLVSVAGLGLTAGTYFGLHAFTLRARSNAHFKDGYCTEQSCHDDWQSAKSSALMSDITLGVGVVALAVGGYVLLRPAQGTRARSALALSVAGGGTDARALLNGEF